MSKPVRALLLIAAFGAALPSASAQADPQDNYCGASWGGNGAGNNPRRCSFTPSSAPLQAGVIGGDEHGPDVTVKAVVYKLVYEQVWDEAKGKLVWIEKREDIWSCTSATTPYLAGCSTTPGPAMSPSDLQQDPRDPSRVPTLHCEGSGTPDGIRGGFFSCSG